MTKAANDEKIEKSGPISKAGFFYLTGFSHPQKQAEVLRSQNIRFTVRGDGSLCLTWEAYNMQLCQQEQQPAQTGPNMSFLNGRKA